MDPFEAIAAMASILIFLLVLDSIVCIVFALSFFVRSVLWLIHYRR